MKAHRQPCQVETETKTFGLVHMLFLADFVHKVSQLLDCAASARALTDCICLASMVSDASTVFSSSTRLKLEQMSLTPLQACSFALHLYLQEMHALQELYLLSKAGKHHLLAQSYGSWCTACQTVLMTHCSMVVIAMQVWPCCSVQQAHMHECCSSYLPAAGCI